MASIDELKKVEAGDEITAAQQNVIRELFLSVAASGGLAFADGTGVYFRTRRGGGGGGTFDFAVLLSTLNCGGAAQAQPLKYDEVLQTLVVDEDADPILVFDYTMTSGGFDVDTRLRHESYSGHNVATFPPCMIQME